MNVIEKKMLDSKECILDRIIIELEKEVKNELWKNEPKVLEEILWRDRWNGFMFDYGPYSTEFLIKERRFTKNVVELFESNNMLDGLQNYYLEWFTYTQNELMINEEEIKDIEDEEVRYEVSHNSVDPDGFIYIGFQNYLYYLTQNILDVLSEKQIEKYSEILLQNGIENVWGWMTDNNEEDSGLEILKIHDELDWENIEDLVEYIVEFNLPHQKYEIIHTKDWKTDNYEFNTFEEFVSELKELKSSLDEMDCHNKIIEN